jgi:hypothetical protein
MGQKRAIKVTEISWIEFLKKHRDSWEVTEIEGTSKMHWKCSCGIERFLPLNSGIPLGLKVQVWTHFEEIKKGKGEQ